MADSIKWLRLLREQRKDLHAEIDRQRIEYEADLLIKKKENDWLSAQLIESQHKVRLLTYEIERKEGEISDLRKHLRRTEKLGRSTPQTENDTENVTDGTCESSGACPKHDQFIRVRW